MSRDLTAGMVTEVTATSLKPVLLLKAEFDGGDVLFWTGIGSLTWNGDTYVGAGNLLGVKAISEVSTIQADNVDVTLSGIPSSIISTALNEDYQGRPAYIYFAALDSNDQIIADPYQLFKGRMDILEMSEGAETATLTMRCENRLIDLQRAKVRRYTQEDQQAYYPTDKGFEFVTSLQDKPVTWGQDA